MMISFPSLPLVAPSLLSADKCRLEEEIRFAISNGTRILHFDVMDGIFVPNVTFGLPLFKELLKAFPSLLFDSHLMVKEPKELASAFAKEGSDIVTVHYEAFASEEDLLKTLRLIRSAGSKAGLSIKPNTEVEVLLPYLSECDLVLIMSVEPGKGGQSFLPSSLPKLSWLKEKKASLGRNDFLLEVDGGINEKTAPLALKSGAEILVAGSYLFGHPDFKERMEGLLK